MTESGLIAEAGEPANARLYAIVARAARRAVIFRRGPTKRVRLLTWDLATDQIGAGQWFKGRIYERRCDLSPSGDMLVYFAASFRRPYYSWTAVSRPPFFTALALWPKGDCWGGGGLFETDRKLCLNHSLHQFALADGFTLPPGFQVEPLGAHSGGGEDQAILWQRRLRDGWIQLPAEVDARRKGRGKRWYIDPPLTVQKSSDGRSPHDLLLRQHPPGTDETRGRWHVETADLASPDGCIVLELGRLDWADLDHNGDVIYAQDGRLFRLPKPTARQDSGQLRPRLVADLNDMEFEPIKPPDWAQRWD